MSRGRPVIAKHDAQMHYGQSRGSQKMKKNKNKVVNL